MKRYKYLMILLSVPLFLAFTPAVSAQMMDEGTNASTSSSDDQKGQNIYDQLQNKQTTCTKLTDDDFDALGDFYMGRMMGSAHDTMDQYMTQHLGANGERQAHIAMGERLSGCNESASYPSGASGYMPMAWMGMMGGNSNDWDNMMGAYNNTSWSGTDTALSALFVIAIAAALLAWLRPHRSVVAPPLDVLKVRYAKGEITKEQFDQLKKDLK